MFNERTCRVCGCTDDDCGQCVVKTGFPCSWVQSDLCSACLGEQITLRVACEFKDSRGEQQKLTLDLDRFAGLDDNEGRIRSACKIILFERGWKNARLGDIEAYVLKE